MGHLNNIKMEIKKSYFTIKLESNPDLAARCEEVVRFVRDSAENDVMKGLEAERITPSDLATYINAHSDNY